MSLITLPTFLTRRREGTTMTDATITEATETPTTVAGNILMRFLTQGGATVVVTGSGKYAAKDCHWKCLGCGNENNKKFPAYDWSARNEANEHATDCRSMPKPEA